MITMPTPTSEDTVVAPDGISLHLERFVPKERPVGVLVFVHGFSAHIGNFRHVGRACADAGIAATLFDCRGHGRSQGRRGHVDRFADFVGDLDLVLAGARALHPTVPVALAAHSHGAMICLEYVLETGERRPRLTRPSDVQAIALAAPFFALKLKVPFIKRAAARPLGRLWPTLALPNGIKGADVSRTPEVQAGFDADPLVHHVATARWFNEVRAAQARVMAASVDLSVPTLISVAGQDRVVSNQAAFDFARAAGTVVEVKVYDKLFHEMFLEPERDLVTSDLVAWIGDRFDA